MTTEKAIKYAEAIKAKTQEKIEFYRRGNAHAQEVYYSDLAFLSAAISALREQEERENKRPLTLEIQNLDLRKIVLWALVGVEYQYTQTHSLMTENVADHICQAIEKSVAKNERNEPLTLDELMEMDGEPVWLKIAGGVWGLVDMNVSVVWLNRGGDIDLGKIAGLAYRSKPKEDA